MKRRDLIGHLKKHHCRLAREGSNHSIWVSGVTGAWASIPRHTDVKETLVKAICRQLGIPRP
ncbi:MAG: type II toxin-antitoxin system HicA family toxin [Gemmatimonadetes bacterium]|nr:type II toxin-antitoxin system HicA family toxin [Gemmatimonadota bacterium]